ncbi:hypothetical protein OM076_20625 [Solirubrobacter ginsenosidimutans]|uniref:Uncharacterized protein n=1 Tax=Solirubrobacter ginsenosidimutans TaxID=490573 RepID=A0A9X3S1R3_9ACTN|nr:hypothetical protein [Solirubrobacter ginsenosidimutans]MDA0162689.1 hypothetical protein [Solirubrobacter ginsenosidimutans]
MQPWPGEVLDERSGEIAVGFAALLTRQAAWRHRRVETISVLSHERVRRHVSVDFTVPAAHRDELALSEGEWVVPLAYLAKRLLVNFDLFMEDEAAVPLLRSDEAQLISRELLYVMLDLDTEEAVEADVGPLIEWILAAGPGEEDAVDAAVGELEDTLGSLPGFVALAEQLTRGFLLCAVVGDVSRRRVIKFAYDQPLARPARSVHFYDTPGCTEAASYHAEVDVPDEMRARTTNMIDNLTGEVLASGPRDADRPAIHYVAAAEARVLPGLIVRYGTERGRFLVPAMLVAWVIALGLTLPWLFADLPSLAGSPSPAIAILLSSSAIFSGLVLRSGEHPLVRLMLAPYRLCLVAATVAVVVAGGTLAFHASDGTLRWVWGLGALVAVLSASILSVEAARAPAAARDR